MPTATAFAIENIGWRLAYTMLAASVLLVALPVCWLLPQRQAQCWRGFVCFAHEFGGQSVRQVVRGLRFWLLTLSLMVVGFAVSGLIPNIVPMMTDRGVEPARWLRLIGILGMSIVGGDY
ncbi:MAG: hypothetical protein R3E09_06790 [Novosphingobium sp.]